MKINSLKGKISYKAYNTCLVNQIDNFQELNDHYLNYGSFKMLKYCSEITNSELINYCMINKNTNNEINENYNYGIYKKNETINIDLLEEKLNSDTFNLCLNNEIYSFYELKQQYLIFGSFKHLKNINGKINSELVSCCKNSKIYIDPNDFKTILLNHKIIIDKIEKLNNKSLRILNNYISEKFTQLSVRSQNVLKICLKNELHTEGFVKYFFSSDKIEISKINNIGKKSIPELGFYFKKFIEFIDYISSIDDIELTKIESSSNTILDNIIDLSPFQIELINFNLLIQFEKLSVRSKNGLKLYLNNNIDFDNLHKKIISKINFDYYELHNIGQRSKYELELFFNNIRDFSIKIQQIKDEVEFNNIKLKIYLEKETNGIEIPVELINNNSFFKIILLIIQNQNVFGNNEKYIFENGLNIYENKTIKNLTDLSEILFISKERCRQIRNKILIELGSKFKFLKEINPTFYKKYKIEFDKSIIIISDDIASYINTLDQTNFSKHFITLVISYFYENDYKLLGNVDDLFIKKDFKTKIRHNWQGLYLINISYNNVFDFEKFVEDINIRINEVIYESYELNLINHLNNFIRSNDYIITESLINVCEKIINSEFNIYLNNNKNINFNRTTIKTIPEYVFEVLNFFGKPTHIVEITKQLKILKPDYNSTLTSASLKRKYGIVPYGKTGVYGLKKWENESNNIKSGTIRNIIEEVLLKEQKPVHISDLFQYAIKYRPNINIRSLKTNLEVSKEFIVYPNNYIGLKQKKYDTNSINLTQINGTFFTISNLSKFNNYSINEVLEYFHTKYNYDEKQLRYIINEKVRNGEITLSKNEKLIIKKNTVLSVDEIKINNLEEIIKIIKGGNRLTSYFFFNEYNDIKNKKKSQEIFNYLFNKYN